MSNQQPTPTPSGAITPPPNFFPHQPQPGMVIPQQPIMPPPPIPALEKSRPQLVNNEAITSGEAPRPPKRKNKGGKIIAVLAAIVLIALFGVLAIPRLNLPLPTLGLGPHPTATSSTSASAPTTVTQPTQGVTPVNTATNPISTDTPAATVAPSVGLATTSPTLPLTISCVQCGYPDLALVLMSITANADNSTTLWTFTVTNKGASQCSSITFATLALEGPDGTQYQSSGQASNSWSLNAGTATNVSPTLALVPRSGTIYTLNIQLNGSCMTSSDNTYQTEDLNFAPSLLTGEGPVTPNTISPKSPSLPLNITCVQCGYPQLSLTLTSITVTASNSSTVWSFTITNNGSTACSNITFAQFQLEDPSGTQYQSSGQVRDSWSLNAGSSVAESPTLSFQPQPNTIYTLNIRLNGSCMSFSDNTYQTENVQF